MDDFDPIAKSLSLSSKTSSESTETTPNVTESTSYGAKFQKMKSNFSEKCAKVATAAKDSFRGIPSSIKNLLTHKFRPISVTAEDSRPDSTAIAQRTSSLIGNLHETTSSQSSSPRSSVSAESFQTASEGAAENSLLSRVLDIIEDDINEVVQQQQQQRSDDPVAQAQVTGALKTMKNALKGAMESIKTGGSKALQSAKKTFGEVQPKLGKLTALIQTRSEAKNEGNVPLTDAVDTLLKQETQSTNRSEVLAALVNEDEGYLAFKLNQKRRELIDLSRSSTDQTGIHQLRQEISLRKMSIHPLSTKSVIAF